MTSKLERHLVCAAPKLHMDMGMPSGAAYDDVSCALTFVRLRSRRRRKWGAKSETVGVANVMEDLGACVFQCGEE